MKVNLDYYRPNNELNKLTSEEISILDKFFKDTYESIDSYDKLLTLESSFSEIKALSDNRKNIVEFYPIGKEETVLEIGAGFGEVTSSFVDRAKKVIAIESKKEKAEVIAKRYSSYDNLEVYAGEIEDINLNEKFDIVINFAAESHVAKSIENPDIFINTNIKAICRNNIIYVTIISCKIRSF